MMKSLTRSLVAVVYLLTNVLFAHAAETSLWSERRARANDGARAPRLASAALVPNLAAVLDATRPGRRPLGSIRTPAVAVDARSTLAEVVRRLPAAAQIRDVRLANGKDDRRPAVLLIQDVHLNREAQENIADILEAAQAAAPPGAAIAIGVEGAFAPFDFSAFDTLPDRALTAKVARHFLQNNRIAASSYVGIANGPGAPRFYGVDDERGYFANVDAYLASRRSAGQYRDAVDRAVREIADRKRATLNPGLLRFDSLRTAHRSGSLGFGAYVDRLAASHPGDVPPAASGFLDAYRLEARLDFGRVERERRAVVERLVAALSKGELAELVEKSLAYRAGGVRNGDYYRFLSRLCRRRGVDLSRTPAFDDYVRYVLLADAIQAAPLLAAVREMEDAAIDRLAARPEERDLLERGDAAFLSARLGEFGLTPDEWRQYALLRRKSPVPEDLRRPFEAFYEAADRRSAALVDNLLAMPAPEGFPVRGVVVGGFHTPVIAERLNARGVDVAVIQPALTKIEGLSGTEYLSVFTREKTPLERLLAGEKLFLAPAALLPGTPAGAAVQREQILWTLAAAGREGVYANTAVTVVRRNGVEVARIEVNGEIFEWSRTGEVPDGYVEIESRMPPPEVPGLPALTAIAPAGPRRLAAVRDRILNAVRRMMIGPAWGAPASIASDVVMATPDRRLFAVDGASHYFRQGTDRAALEEQIRRVVAGALRATTEDKPDDINPVSGWSDSIMAALRQETAAVYFLFDAVGRLQGVLQADLRTEGTLRIERLAVDPSDQRGGGSLLMDAALSRPGIREAVWLAINDSPIFYHGYLARRGHRYFLVSAGGFFVQLGERFPPGVRRRLLEFAGRLRGQMDLLRVRMAAASPNAEAAVIRREAAAAMFPSAMLVSVAGAAVAVPESDLSYPPELLTESYRLPRAYRIGRLAFGALSLGALSIERRDRLAEVFVSPFTELSAFVWIAAGVFNGTYAARRAAFVADRHLDPRRAPLRERGVDAVLAIAAAYAIGLAAAGAAAALAFVAPVFFPEFDVAARIGLAASAALAGLAAGGIGGLLVAHGVWNLVMPEAVLTADRAADDIRVELGPARTLAPSPLRAPFTALSVRPASVAYPWGGSADALSFGLAPAFDGGGQNLRQISDALAAALNFLFNPDPMAAEAVTTDDATETPAGRGYREFVQAPVFFLLGDAVDPLPEPVREFFLNERPDGSTPLADYLDAAFVMEVVTIIGNKADQDINLTRFVREYLTFVYAAENGATPESRAANAEMLRRLYVRFALEVAAPTRVLDTSAPTRGWRLTERRPISAVSPGLRPTVVGAAQDVATVDAFIAHAFRERDEAAFYVFDQLLEETFETRDGPASTLWMVVVRDGQPELLSTSVTYTRTAGIPVFRKVWTVLGSLSGGRFHYDWFAKRWLETVDLLPLPVGARLNGLMASGALRTRPVSPSELSELLVRFNVAFGPSGRQIRRAADGRLIGNTRTIADIVGVSGSPDRNARFERWIDRATRIDARRGTDEARGIDNAVVAMLVEENELPEFVPWSRRPGPDRRPLATEGTYGVGDKYLPFLPQAVRRRVSEIFIAPLREWRDIARILIEDARVALGANRPQRGFDARTRFLLIHTARMELAEPLEATVRWTWRFMALAPPMAVAAGALMAWLAPGSDIVAQLSLAAVGALAAVVASASFALTFPHFINNVFGERPLTSDVDAPAGSADWEPVPADLMRPIKYGYIRGAFVKRTLDMADNTRRWAAADLRDIIPAIRQVDPTLSVFARDWLEAWSRLLFDGDPETRRTAALALPSLVSAAAQGGLSRETLDRLSGFYVSALTHPDRAVRDVAMTHLPGWKNALDQSGGSVQADFVRAYGDRFRAAVPLRRVGPTPWWRQQVQKATLRFTEASWLRMSAFSGKAWLTNAPQARQQFATALFRADPTGARFDAVLAPLYRLALEGPDRNRRARAASELEALAVQALSLDPSGRLVTERVAPLLAIALNQGDESTIAAALNAVARLLPFALQSDPAIHDVWLALYGRANERMTVSGGTVSNDDATQEYPVMPELTAGAELRALGVLSADETAVPLGYLMNRLRNHIGAENFEEAAAPLGIQLLNAAYDEARQVEAAGDRDGAMRVRGHAWSQVIEILRGIKARPRAAGRVTGEFIETVVRTLAAGGDINPTAIRHGFEYYFNKPFEWDRTKLSADDLTRSTIRIAPGGFSGPKELLGHMVLDFAINRLNPDQADPINTFQIYMRTTKDSPSYAELKPLLAAAVNSPFFLSALQRFDRQGRDVPLNERNQYWGAVRRLFRVLFRDAEAYNAVGMERNLEELTGTPEATVESLTEDLRSMMSKLDDILPDGPRRTALLEAMPNGARRATAAEAAAFLQRLDRSWLFRSPVATIFAITKPLLAADPTGPLASRLKVIQGTAQELPRLSPSTVRSATEWLRQALSDIRSELPAERETVSGRPVENWRDTAAKAVVQLTGVLARLVVEPVASRVAFEGLRDDFARFERVAAADGFAITPLTEALAELRAVNAPDDILFEAVAERISDYLNKEIQMLIRPESPAHNPGLSAEFVALTRLLIDGMQTVKRSLEVEHWAADLQRDIAERVTEIGYLSKKNTVNKFIQFRVDRWAVGISGKVAEVFGLDVTDPADVILTAKENQALTYIARHAQFRTPDHPLRVSMAAYFRALLEGRSRPEAAVAFRSRLNQIYADSRPDLLGREPGSVVSAWYLDNTSSLSTILSAPPAMESGELEISLLNDPIEMLHLGWKIAHSCLDIVTGTHQEFAGAYLLTPLIGTVSIQQKGADPSKPALFRANLAFDPAAGTLFLINGVRDDVPAEHKELLGRYLRAWVDHLQARAEARGERRTISAFVPKSLYYGMDRAPSKEEAAAYQASPARGGRQEFSLGGGFLETTVSGLRIERGLMPLHADIVNVRVATYENQEWVSPELEGWAYTPGNPVVPRIKPAPKGGTQLTTDWAFAMALRAFSRYGITPTMRMVGAFAAVVEALSLFNPLFLARHPDFTAGRAAGLLLVFGAMALTGWTTWDPSVAAGLVPALTYVAKILGANIALHGAWNLLFSRPDPGQRSILEAVRELRSGDAERRELAERLIAALPEIEDLRVRKGVDLRGDAVAGLRQTLSETGDRAILPALWGISRPNAGPAAEYDGMAKHADVEGIKREYQVLDGRLGAAGVRAEMRNAVDKLKTGPARQMVLAVGSGVLELEWDDLVAEAAGMGILLRRNDADLFGLEADPALAASRVGVFLSPTASIDGVAMEALQTLSRGRPADWLTIYVLDAVTRIAVEVTMDSLSNMLRMHVLLGTQA